MTRIEILPEGQSFRLTAEGHAGGREGDTDVVCAAVSGSLIAFAAWLQKLERLEDYSTGDGKLTLRWRDEDGGTLPVLDYLLTEWRVIGDRYPGTVEIA
jgi:uncharacterized protein YsxB (DUF464 family)